MKKLLGFIATIIMVVTTILIFTLGIAYGFGRFAAIEFLKTARLFGVAYIVALIQLWR